MTQDRCHDQSLECEHFCLSPKLFSMKLIVYCLGIVLVEYSNGQKLSFKTQKLIHQVPCPSLLFILPILERIRLFPFYDDFKDNE